MPHKVASEHPLIFDWALVRSRFGRLLLAFLGVLVGLTLFFFVFRVVYPQSERFTPIPHQAVMLDPGNPATTSIMNRVRDVDYLLLPSRHQQDSAPTLQSQAPVFHPSFEGHQLTLQDLPHRQFTAPPPRLLDADAPVLPPLDLSELKSHNPRPVFAQANTNDKKRHSRLRMKFHGLAESRLPRNVPDVFDVPVIDPGTCRFKIGIISDGRVAVALPLSTPEPPAAGASLADRVRRLRFAPLTPEMVKDAPAIEWGEISFEWGAAP
jgi:hypothetical protein